jgi:hypothetical protein
MGTDTSTRSAVPAASATSPSGQWPVRVVGAALLLAMAWIHEHLYGLGFSSVPTIGPLFRVNAVLGVVAALALLAAPRRVLAVVELGCGLLLAGTLAGLFVSMTVGLFGFTETWDAPMIRRTIAVEAVGAVLLVVAAVRRGLPDPRRLRQRSGAVGKP